jgi:tRNA pseudouridine13 synthase
MVFDLSITPPLITSTLPGIGGRIKQVVEDFEVEEIPAYQPSGNGPFLYLWMEKRDMGAEFFVRQVARRLGISPGEVGTAGLKDRRAVTRQMVSVPEGCADRLGALEGDGMRLLQVDRHGNKLRPGHLHGNCFRILIRSVDPEAEKKIKPLIEQLQKEGLPNYYGAQRFGHDGETLALGLALLRDDGRTVEGSRDRRRSARNPFLRKLSLSAAQSALFNHYLARRLADGFFARVLQGDVMAKKPTGGLFVAQEVEREQARYDMRETVPTGPIFGRKMFPAAADAAVREAAVLESAGLTPASFAGFGKLLQGTRRQIAVYVPDLTAVMEAEGMRVSFTLPAGSYATVLLEEIIKDAIMDRGETASY